ncbi:MAG: EmrB/QacA subfamily drug resistance transporter [Candidatus Frackibacter sp. T328-2]|nr:MAG: EmrB/QacA subfamily drug resistance transporter [Candidatus Frackibacter sp. T328-2]
MSKQDVKSIEQKTEEENGAYKWIVLGVVLIGAFMAILDTSIVNIALAEMMSVFGVTYEEIDWVVTAYLLSMGVIQPITGYLSNNFGAKRMYIFSLIVFTIGSALCGMAWSRESMIFFRIIQAIGGGMIMPISNTIIYQVFPLEERGMALGIWGIAAMAAPAIGPTLGGYIVQNLNWRVIFTINIPIGIIGVVLAGILLKETEIIPSKKFDFIGFITASIGFASVLYALSEASSKGWDEAYVLAILAVGILMLILFVINELQITEPLIDLRIFKKRNFTFSMISVFFVTIGLYGGIFLLPLYLQNIRGYTALQTGLLLMPIAIVTGIMMPIAGWLFDRIGARPLALTGISLMVFSMYKLHGLNLVVSSWYIQFWMIIRAIGLGLTMMPVTTAALNAISEPKMAQAAATRSLVTRVAGSFGLAILSPQLEHRRIFHFNKLANGLKQGEAIVSQTLNKLQHGILVNGNAVEHLQQKALVMLYGNISKQAMANAFGDTFLLVAVFCSLGLIPALFIEKHPDKN